MYVTRLKAPKPRKGFLAAFDQPTFRTRANCRRSPTGSTRSPSFPSTPRSCSTSSRRCGLAGRPREGRGDARHSQVQIAGGRPQGFAPAPRSEDGDLRHARYGHRSISPATRPRRKPLPPRRPRARSASGPLAGMLGSLGGGIRLPRYTLIAEIDDAVAFGKTRQPDGGREPAVARAGSRRRRGRRSRQRRGGQCSRRRRKRARCRLASGRRTPAQPGASGGPRVQADAGQGQGLHLEHSAEPQP